MSLRPRYSLLTLLILTALVAGGVKLWHGPHHVVEPLKDSEMEYTFTRDWRGNKIKQGPGVWRLFHQQKHYRSELFYCRQGEHLRWIFRAMNHPADKPRQDDFPKQSRSLSLSPLTPQEQLEFQALIDRERVRLPPPTENEVRIEYHGQYLGDP